MMPYPQPVSTVPLCVSQVPKYEQRRGTLVQFLDEFEKSVMKKYPFHRFTVMRQKGTARQFDQNRGPGWVQSDIDFGMDGEILPPRGKSIQSDHWSPMGYTIFINVVSWLRSNEWKKREGDLTIGDHVTVEPKDVSVPDSVTVVQGSYFAEIIHTPTNKDVSANEHLYAVRRDGQAELV